MSKLDRIQAIIADVDTHITNINYLTMQCAIYHMTDDTLTKVNDIALHRLYSYVADDFDTSIKAIESRLRRFQDSLFKNSDAPKLIDIFGPDFLDMSHREFMFALAEYVVHNA